MLTKVPLPLVLLSLFVISNISAMAQEAVMLDDANMHIVLNGQWNGRFVADRKSDGVETFSTAATLLIEGGIASFSMQNNAKTKWKSSVEINDGKHPDYQQPTPKQRILAALRDVKEAKK